MLCANMKPFILIAVPLLVVGLIFPTDAWFYHKLMEASSSSEELERSNRVLSNRIPLPGGSRAVVAPKKSDKANFAENFKDSRVFEATKLAVLDSSAESGSSSAAEESWKRNPNEARRTKRQAGIPPVCCTKDPCDPCATTPCIACPLCGR